MKYIARSSNGRTTDSGSVYLGSNPSLAAVNINLFFHAHSLDCKGESENEDIERIKEYLAGF